MTPPKERGYIQVYTGDGKGKTTAAFGLSLRAVGAGKKVFFAQFVKGQIYSEINTVKRCLPTVTVRQYGLACFIINAPTVQDMDMARRGFAEVSEIIAAGEYDIVVLDEACIAIHYNLFTVEELIRVLANKPFETEIVITGRYAPVELVEFADLVTDMQEVKHYYTQGVAARPGIEY